MTTRTITVSPEEARAGDLFSGTIERNGASITVLGSLHVGTFDRGQLWVVSSLPYINNPDWQNVTITREVEVPEFAPGTVVRWQNDKLDTYYLYLRDGEGVWHDVFESFSGKNRNIRLSFSYDEDFQGWIASGIAKVVYDPKENS